MRQTAWTTITALKLGAALTFAALTLVQRVSAQGTDPSYPDRPAADACGGGPGDPPFFTFLPGSVSPVVSGSPDSNTFDIWRRRIRPDLKLVLLTGLADTFEAGYTPGLALKRAEAVKAMFLATGLPPDAIWVRGKDVSPNTASEREALFSRSVTISDPLRAAACGQDLAQARFIWYIEHCSGQKINRNTRRSCDIAIGQLSGEKPVVSEGGSIGR